MSEASLGDGPVLGVLGWFVVPLGPDRPVVPGVGGAPVVSRAVGDAVCSACPETIGVAGVSRGLAGAGGSGAGRGGSGGSVMTGASVPTVESVDLVESTDSVESLDLVVWSALTRPSDPPDGAAGGC